MSEAGVPPPEAASSELPASSQPSESGSPSSETAARTRRSPATNFSNLPPWLRLAAVAVVPAVVVGLVVFFVARGSGGSSNDGSLAGSIVDGFLRLGGDNTDSSSIHSFVKKLPPGYPGDLPSYPGSSLIASYSMDSGQGTTYFALYSSKDAVSRVQQFFSDRLDKDPWQLTAAQNSATSTGVRFSRPSDPDVDGSISVNRSDLDPRTTIYVSVQDSSGNNSKSAPAASYTPSPSLDLPPGFPNDVPIYKKDAASTVTDTLFQRDSGKIGRAHV